MKWTFTPKLLLSALCAGLVALTACSKTNEPEPTLSISAKTVALTTAGDVQDVEITSNQSWTASKPVTESWCVLKQDGNKLRISAEPQTKTTTRTTQITITAGALTASISVTQAGANPLLTVDKEVVLLTTDGKAVPVTVTTNLDAWEASRPDADSWCTLKQSGNTLEISADPQVKATPRSTQVTLSARGLTTPVIIEVSQGGATPVLTLDKSSVELDIAGTAATVTVTTNLDSWSASHPAADDWCTVTKSDNTFTISATLCTVAERSTIVTVEAGGNTLTRPIAVTQKGGALSYEITVPTDFSECAVKKAVYNQEKVAEICLEYIRSQNAQMTVIYPIVEGKADLTQGLEVSTGGIIVWDLAANTCTYTPGSAQALKKVWIEDGKVKSTTESKTTVAATVTSDLLVDVRGASSEIYKIVKIGTQYWMGENLRAERYLDGSAISTDWKDNTTGAYCYLYDSPADNKAIFGALYNGYATYHEAGLAPQGWEVPDNAAWTKLRTYIGTPYGTKLKSISYWKTNKGTNLTGFDARPAQNYSTATGFTDAIETWFWSKDVTYDPLTKSNSQFYARLVDSNTGMTFNSDKSFGTFHSQAFGHSVRCLRK